MLVGTSPLLVVTIVLIFMPVMTCILCYHLYYLVGAPTFSLIILFSVFQLNFTVATFRVQKISEKVNFKYYKAEKVNSRFPDASAWGTNAQTISDIEVDRL
jgi:hypothetical protein